MYLPPFGINSATAIQVLRSSPSETPNAVSPWVSSPTMLVRPRFLLSPVLLLTRPLPAGQLVYTDPDTGVASVYNGGDIAWVLASTALVWLMIPGVGFFYSGLLRRKNALSLIYLAVAVIGVISFEVCGFLTLSLAAR